MNKFSRLTNNERIKIDIFYNINKYSIREIAYELSISPNTVSREINLGKSKIAKHIFRTPLRYRWNKVTPIDKWWFYEAKAAQTKANERRKNSVQILKIEKNNELRKKILHMLINLYYKPDVISGTLRRFYPNDKSLHVAPETIYRWIYKMNYQQYLQKGNKKYRKKRGNTTKRHVIKNRVSIHERQDITNEFGHFEGDSIVSKMHSSGMAIHTEVERISRYLFTRRINKKCALDTKNAMHDIFYPIQDIAKSTTLDNGTENHLHYELNKLGINTYFADPYSSWQRGSNERHNGLIRRFIPKKTDLSKITDKDLEDAVNFWNNMPRKILGYKTPQEVWDIEVNKIRKKQKEAV